MITQRAVITQRTVLREAPLSHPSSCSLVDPGVTTIPIILTHLHVLFLQSRGSPQPSVMPVDSHRGQGNGLFWDYIVLWNGELGGLQAALGERAQV